MILTPKAQWITVTLDTYLSVRVEIKGFKKSASSRSWPLKYVFLKFYSTLINNITVLQMVPNVIRNNVKKFHDYFHPALGTWLRPVPGRPRLDQSSRRAGTGPWTDPGACACEWASVRIGALSSLFHRMEIKSETAITSRVYTGSCIFMAVSKLSRTRWGMGAEVLQCAVRHPARTDHPLSREPEVLSGE